MTGLRNINEDSMLKAHAAGRQYYRSNRPETTDRAKLRAHANSCGWHGEDADAWLAGYLGERTRMHMPSPDQLAALQAYAKAHGRSWKAKLESDWINAAAGPQLQQLRNTLGPSWLARYKLPTLD